MWGGGGRRAAAAVHRLYSRRRGRGTCAHARARAAPCPHAYLPMSTSSITTSSAAAAGAGLWARVATTATSRRTQKSFIVSDSTRETLLESRSGWNLAGPWCARPSGCMGWNAWCDSIGHRGTGDFHRALGGMLESSIAGPTADSFFPLPLAAAAGRHRQTTEPCKRLTGHGNVRALPRGTRSSCPTPVAADGRRPANNTPAVGTSLVAIKNKILQRRGFPPGKSAARAGLAHQRGIGAPS